MIARIIDGRIVYETQAGRVPLDAIRQLQDRLAFEDWRVSDECIRRIDEINRAIALSAIYVRDVLVD